MVRTSSCVRPSVPREPDEFRRARAGIKAAARGRPHRLPAPAVQPAGRAVVDVEPGVEQLEPVLDLLVARGRAVAAPGEVAVDRLAIPRLEGRVPAERRPRARLSAERRRARRVAPREDDEDAVLAGLEAG